MREGLLTNLCSLWSCYIALLGFMEDLTNQQNLLMTVWHIITLESRSSMRIFLTFKFQTIGQGKQSQHPNRLMSAV